VETEFTYVREASTEGVVLQFQFQRQFGNLVGLLDNGRDGDGNELPPIMDSTLSVDVTYVDTVDGTYKFRVTAFCLAVCMAVVVMEILIFGLDERLVTLSVSIFDTSIPII
jgi:hypothetical protein